MTSVTSSRISGTGRTVRCVATLLVCLLTSAASADLGAVHVFMRVQPEVTAEFRDDLNKRLVKAHLGSPLEADHFHFFVRVDLDVKDESYWISIGRAPYVDEIAISIGGSAAGVRHAVREVEMAFQQGTLFDLKSAWRKGPVKQPVLEKKKE